MQEGENDLLKGDVFAMLAARKSTELEEDTREKSVEEKKSSQRDILRKKENQVRARPYVPSEFSRVSKDRD